FTSEVFTHLTEEVDRLEQFALEKNYISEYENTPRIMKTINGIQICKASRTIGVFCVHHEIHTLVTSILDGPFYTTPIAEATMGIHYLLDAGWTHGWHLDGSIFCILVVIIHAPPREQGGTLECIPNWQFYAKKFGYQEKEPLEKYVKACRKENLIH